MLLTRENLRWPYQEPLTIPPQALAHFRQAQERGRQQQEEWQARLEAYRQAYPEEARQLEEALSGEFTEGLGTGGLADLFKPGDKPIATREASGQVMNAIADQVHTFIGGSADLAPSTKTLLKDHGHYGFEDYCGHNMHFGVREHAMGSIANGMALSRRHSALYRHFPDLLGLHAPANAIGRIDGTAGGLHLHPRLHRPGRGRANASAHRAAPGNEGSPQPGSAPACRCHRVGGGMEGGPGAPSRADSAGVNPPELAGAGPDCPGPGQRGAEGRVHPMGGSRPAESHPHRHRLRAPHRLGSRKSCYRRRVSPPALYPCPPGSCSTPSQQNTATVSCLLT